MLPLPQYGLARMGVTGRGSRRGVSAANALDFDFDLERQMQLALLAPLSRLRRPLPSAGEAKTQHATELSLQRRQQRSLEG